MIVDTHTHFLDFDRHCGPQVAADLERCEISPSTWRFSPEDHLRATEPADVAIVFGLRAARTGWHVPNDAVAEHVLRGPTRLIFFAAIDPGEDGYMGELERCHRELGCQGVKVGPIYQGVHPLDSRFYELYGYCQRHDLAIITHMATTFSSGVPLDYARPIHIDQVSCDFPDLKVVMSHLGHPWQGEAIAVIRKQPNIYADVSALYYRPWQFYNMLRLAVEYKAEGKLLFGSDFPATTTDSSISGLRNVNAILGSSGLPAIPESAIEEIIHRDSLSLLGLRRPGRAEEL